MHITLFQVNMDRDKDRLAFCSLDTVKREAGAIPAEIYDKVFEGDIDCDGAVTAADVMMQYNRLLNNDYSSPATCDIDGDGSVTVADVTAIYNTILGNE